MKIRKVGKKTDRLRTSGPVERHGSEVSRFSFCFIGLWSGTGEASNPEIPMGLDTVMGRGEHVGSLDFHSLPPSSYKVPHPQGQWRAHGEH